MIPMTAEEIAELNAMYAESHADQPADSSYVIVRKVAADANLELVRWDDQSGGLYQDFSTKRYVYGWESGGFDDQIGDLNA